MAKVKAKGLYS